MPIPELELARVKRALDKFCDRIPMHVRADLTNLYRFPYFATARVLPNMNTPSSSTTNDLVLGLYGGAISSRTSSMDMPSPLLATGRVATFQNSAAICGVMQRVSPASSNSLIVLVAASCFGSPESAARSTTFVSTNTLSDRHESGALGATIHR